MRRQIQMDVRGTTVFVYLMLTLNLLLFELPLLPELLSESILFLLRTQGAGKKNNKS